MTDIRERAYGVKKTGRTSMTHRDAPAEPVKRKRGRPTNAEREARKAAEAMAESVVSAENAVEEGSSAE